jgi:GxxExxY protein
MLPIVYTRHSARDSSNRCMKRCWRMRFERLALASQHNLLYDGLELELGFRLDLLIERAVIAELKAAENMIPLFEAQLMTYLRLSGIRLGYLINFNVPHLKHGIRRIVV